MPASASDVASNNSAPAAAASDTTATASDALILEREDELIVGHLFRGHEIDQPLIAVRQGVLAVAVAGFHAQQLRIERNDDVAQHLAAGNPPVGMEADDGAGGV